MSSLSIRGGLIKRLKKRKNDRKKCKSVWKEKDDKIKNGKKDYFWSDFYSGNEKQLNE